MLLPPITAGPPLLADRIAKRLTRRAENETAPQRRLATMLFGLASEVSSAGEIRAYGLSEHLAAGPELWCRR